jgi:uncharacterized membrane protein YqgA involved in biofilm formation
MMIRVEFNWQFVSCLLQRVGDLTRMEAFQRALFLAIDAVRESGEFIEAVISALVDPVIGAALSMTESLQKIAKILT